MANNMALTSNFEKSEMISLDAGEKSPFNLLPKEIMLEIFSWLELSDLARASQVNKDWSKTIGEDMKTSAWINQFAFGKERWERYFKVFIENVPLPKGIHAILIERDPWDPSKRVRELYSLFLAPDKVRKGGEVIPLTIDNVPRIREGTSAHPEYTYYDDAVKDHHGDKTVSAHWVLMRNKVIPDSRGNNFEARKALLDGTDCKVPRALDVILKEMIYNAKSDEGHYREEEDTYTHCQEPISDGNFIYQTVVGGLSRSDLEVHYNMYFDDDDVALLVSRKF